MKRSKVLADDYFSTFDATAEESYDGDCVAFLRELPYDAKAELFSWRWVVYDVAADDSKLVGQGVCRSKRPFAPRVRARRAAREALAAWRSR